jgi:Right handed beta helix region
VKRDSRRCRAGWIAAAIFALLAPYGHCATYHIDCGSASASDPPAEMTLHTLGEVNALELGPGDTLLFKRGTTCSGTLQPRGSGSEAQPIRVAAYGEGSLPRIVDGFKDAAALRLSDQQFWEIESLDVSGSTTYGVLVESARAIMHHIVLRDLLVHNVRGSLKHKESGLLVIHSTGTGGSFDGVLVDGVRAFDTTQWSGIFVSDAAHVQVINSVAHDVQGDGIVVFSSHDAVIAHSLAWHTGMQHQETIGTPNAIWTWRCTDCVVEDNEAFLTDSPGVDGGAFDIDFGNTRDTVRRNYGHDTDGYCVSVFGAFGPTTSSVVEDNLCRVNGLAPRLAQRQGAILLMTWQGGSIDGLVVRNNRVEWNPPGDTPAVRGGADLRSTGIVLSGNQIRSTGMNFIDPELKYTGNRNVYSVASGGSSELAAAKMRYRKLPESNSTIQVWTGVKLARVEGTWSLTATTSDDEPERNRVRATFVQLMSAALQFGHAGLRVTLAGDADVLLLAADWQLPEAGVVLQARTPGTAPSVKLISPNGKAVEEWKYPGCVDLGSALNEHLGRPNFAFLPFEDVRATD